MKGYIHKFGSLNIYEINTDLIAVFKDYQVDMILNYYKGFSIKKNTDAILKKMMISSDKVEVLKKQIAMFLKELSRMGLLPDYIDDFVITGESNKYYPKYLNLELTNKCNLFCSHCYKEATVKNSDFISETTLKELANKLRGKTQMFHLTGGEPLLHPYLNQFINNNKDYYLFNITTNGILLNSYPIETINAFNSISISLYGYNESSYLKATKVSGAFDKLKKSISKLKSNNIPFMFLLTINKDFIENEEQYMQFIIESGAYKVQFGSISPSGRAMDNQVQWLLDKEFDYQNYIEHLSEKYSDQIDMNLITDDNDFMNNTFIPDMLPNCGAGSLQYTVNEQNQLRYCHSLTDDNFNIGNYDLLFSRVSVLHNDFCIKSNKYINKVGEEIAKQVCSACIRYEEIS